jgi:hypothetical protein
MEVEVDDATVVSAHGAAPSSLVDEDALELLESTSDGLSDTALASPTPRVARELGESVPCARAHLDRTLARRRGRAARVSSVWHWRRDVFVPHERMFAYPADDPALAYHVHG